MADALRHLTRLGVYKAAVPLSRKFLGIFHENKSFEINNLESPRAPSSAISQNQRGPHVLDEIYQLKIFIIQYLFIIEGSAPPDPRRPDLRPQYPGTIYAPIA